MWFVLRVLLAALRLVVRSRTDIVMESIALRYQLEVYRRPRRRVTVTDTDRRFWSTLARSWAGWRTAILLVHGDTVVRWHRTAWRRRWAWKSRRRGPGRPRIDSETQAPIRRMARENPRWGVVRIVGSPSGLWESTSVPPRCGSTAGTRCGAHLRASGAPSSACMRRRSGASDFSTAQTLAFRVFTT